MALAVGETIKFQNTTIGEFNYGIRMYGFIDWIITNAPQYYLDWSNTCEESISQEEINGDFTIMAIAPFEDEDPLYKDITLNLIRSNIDKKKYYIVSNYSIDNFATIIKHLMSIMEWMI